VTLTFDTDLQAFNETLAEYLKHTRSNFRDAVVKKSSDFAFRVRKGLAPLKPEKGAIRTERLEALRAGEGIRLSGTARKYAQKFTIATRSSLKTRMAGGYMERARNGKLKRNGRNWWQVAVDREISLRESGRGYLALSWRFTSLFSQLRAAGGRFGDEHKQQQVDDRLRRFLAGLGFDVTDDGAQVTFSWGGNRTSGEIAALLKEPRQQAIISTALREARADMLTYIRRKQAEAAAKTNLS
jgi:hypothetical protein